MVMRTQNTMIAAILGLLLLAAAAGAADAATSDQIWTIGINSSLNTYSASGALLNSYNPGVNTFSLWDVKANPAGTRVYVSGGDRETLIVNPANYEVINSLPDTGPGQLAITDDGATLYSPMVGNNYVRVVDLRTGTVTATIPVGAYPAGCYLSPDESLLFVPCSDANETYIISTANNTVVNTVAGYSPCDVVFSTDGAKVFILCDRAYTGMGLVHIYTCSASPVYITSITLAHYSWGGSMALEPGGSNLWVTGYDSNTITSYSTSTYALQRTVTLGGSGFVSDICAGTTDYMYVGHGLLLQGYNVNSGTVTLNVTTNDEIYRLTAFRPSSSALNVSEQLVTFTAKTCYRTMGVSGLNVSVFNNGTDTMLYSAMTDSTGSVSFILNPATRYDILFNQSPNINTWYYITPSSSGYVVDIPFWQVIGLTSWASSIYNPPGENIQWSLGVTYNSSTGAGTFAPSYYDTGTVSSVTISIYKNSSGWGASDTLIGNYTPSEASDTWTYNLSIASATSKGYYAIITVVKPTGTQVHSTGLAYTFPGPKVLGGVFPADWYFWIGFGCVFCLYAVGTISKKGLFAIFAAGGGWIFTSWGWYSLVMPDAIAYAAIGFTFILAIVVHLAERERFG